MKKIIIFNVKKKWFDKINNGEKRIEYREIKKYWNNRLLNKEGSFIKFDEVWFKNGYKNNHTLIFNYIKTEIIKEKNDLNLKKCYAIYFD